MPVPASLFGIRASTLAASAVPALGFIAGAAFVYLDTAPQSLRNVAQAAFLVLLGAVSCAWLWLDARERSHNLRPSYFIGLLLAPVVAAPFYFNQSRGRTERLKANLWFVAVVVATAVALWLGVASVAGAQ